MTPTGAPVVLTADRTLMSRHRLLLDGMFVSSQTTTAPRALVSAMLLPRVKHVNGRATVAPLGLRRLQAALLRDDFTDADVALADVDHLGQVIGPSTRFIGLSAGEPGGFGMSSTTMTAVVGGNIYPHAEFRRLLRRVHVLRQQRCPEAKIVFGGPGAWQLASDDGLRRRLGLDHVVTGYAEGSIARLAGAAVAGSPLPEVITTTCAAPEAVPPILGETTMGIIELSRGCGLGCDFCTIAGLPMIHLPLDTILADAETNLRSGQPNLSLLSEDLLRFGAEGINCRPDATLGLLRQLRDLPGIRLLQADHTNIASVAQWTDEQLRDLHHLLGGGVQRHPWLNLGIETASGELLARLGGRPKMKGAGAENWGEFCREQLDRLMRLGYVPMVSLVLASPEETPEDTQVTLDWIRALQGQRVMIFPVIHAPLHEPAGHQPRLTPQQWQIMREAYEFNFRWVPVVYDDSMKAAGISPARRLALEAMGQGNVVQWRYMLRKRQQESLSLQGPRASRPQAVA